MSDPVPPRRRMPPAWGALIGLALTLMALAAGAGRATRSDDFCARCHASVPGHTPGHRAVGCAGCHDTRTSERLGLLAHALTKSPVTKPHSAVDRGACARCHQERAGDWRRLMTTEGHAQHARGAGATECVRCHAGSLHERPSARERCASCHRDVPMRSEPRDEASCVRCHAFAPSRAGERPARATAAVAHGERVDAARVHGAMDCRTCHNPHRAPGETAARDGNDCSNCHRGSIAAQVAAGPEGHRVCLGCHAVHAERERAGIDCGRCHEPPPPMDRGRRAESRVTPWVTFVSGAANAVPDARPDAGAPSAPLHPDWPHDGACASCHRPHTWTARADDCRGCHAEPSNALPRGTVGHGECVGCHDPHGPLPNKSTCATCHAAPGAAARTAPPEPHRDCLSCHAQHSPRPPDATACARCHAQPAERVAHGPAAHQNCTACHTPHGPPAADATACARCHGAEAASVAPRIASAHQNCANCHTPHDASRVTAQNACARCHTQAAAPTAIHRGACTSCHAPHANITARGTDCATCHGGVHANGAERAGSAHARCQACHQPHQPARAALQRCPQCHTQAASTATTWPSNSPHGGRCEGCHSAHGSTFTAPCAQCHAPMNSPTHTGRHTACTQCHAPHRDRPSSAAGWWTRCATCHAAEATAAQTGAPAHRACANCHQRPGLTAPTCATCHARASSALLHAHPAHNNCASCHATHGTSIPARAQCLPCHQNRAQHFPDAPRCQSCHPFGTAGR